MELLEGSVNSVEILRNEGESKWLPAGLLVEATLMGLGLYLTPGLYPTGRALG